MIAVVQSISHSIIRSILHSRTRSFKQALTPSFEHSFCRSLWHYRGHFSTHSHRKEIAKIWNNHYVVKSLTTHVIRCHHIAYNPLFINRIHLSNFAPERSMEARRTEFSDTSLRGERRQPILRRKIHVQANIASCVLRHPKCFRALKTNLPLACGSGRDSLQSRESIAEVSNQ